MGKAADPCLLTVGAAQRLELDNGGIVVGGIVGRDRKDLDKHGLSYATG